MSLKEKLDSQKKQLEAAAPKEALDVMHRAIEDLNASGMMEGVKKTGDTAPDFNLPSARGQSVSLSEKLASGPVVLGFYRGGW